MCAMPTFKTKKLHFTTTIQYLFAQLYGMCHDHLLTKELCLNTAVMRNYTCTLWKWRLHTGGRHSYTGGMALVLICELDIALNLYHMYAYKNMYISSQ